MKNNDGSSTSAAYTRQYCIRNVWIYALVGGTVFRLIIVLLSLFLDFPSLQSNSAMAAASVNPLYTMKRVREGQFLSSLSDNFRCMNKNGGVIVGCSIWDTDHALSRLPPPLVLAAMEPLRLVSTTWQDIWIGLLLLAVDLGIAFCIYQIGCQQACVSLESKWEENLETKMDARIRPRWAWVFGIPLSPPQRPVVVEENEETDKQSSKGTEKDAKGESLIPDQVVSLNELPYIASMVYYCNPVFVVAMNMQSLQSLSYLLILLALREIGQAHARQKNNISLATFYLALACHMEVFPWVYIVPISILISQQSSGRYTIRRALFGKTRGGFY